jgi:hypothetical protein
MIEKLYLQDYARLQCTEGVVSAVKNHLMFRCVSLVYPVFGSCNTKTNITKHSTISQSYNRDTP